MAWQYAKIKRECNNCWHSLLAYVVLIYPINVSARQSCAYVLSSWLCLTSLTEKIVVTLDLPHNPQRAKLFCALEAHKSKIQNLTENMSGRNENLYRRDCTGDHRTQRVFRSAAHTSYCLSTRHRVPSSIRRPNHSPSTPRHSQPYPALPPMRLHLGGYRHRSFLHCNCYPDIQD
jgi:hypothetical protein